MKCVYGDCYMQAKFIKHKLNTKVSREIHIICSQSELIVLFGMIFYIYEEISGREEKWIFLFNKFGDYVCF